MYRGRRGAAGGGGAWATHPGGRGQLGRPVRHLPGGLLQVCRGGYSLEIVVRGKKVTVMD